MPRRTTVKHPQDQLHAVARAWFLEVIRTDCPKVLDDLWRVVYAPLMAALPQSAAVALLRRQLPRGLRFPPGFPQRCVYAGIVRWARRWNLNTPWILERAWRTLSFWATNPKLPLGTPVINTDSWSGGRTSRKVRRPRDHVLFVWFVRHRVCRPPTPLAQLAAGAGATNRNVCADTVRVGVNRVAKRLDLVRPRGRPRKKR